MASIDRWKGNRWRARWRDPSGQSRSKVFARKIDAERHLTAMEHSKLMGSYVDPAAGRVTVGDYWETWVSRQAWRDTSRRHAASHYRNHIEPGLGRRPLNSLRRGDFEAWAARLPVAPRTAGQVTSYISSMLDAAVADGLLAANPARGAKRPKVDVEPVKPFTGDDIDALRAAAADWFAVALDLGLGAGLRQSEAAGLSVDRIDFLRRRLTVDRQLVSLPGGEITFGPPKTRRSYRTVPLADAVLDALAHHIETHGTGADGLVLHRDAEPANRHRFDLAWRQLRVRAGLAGARFHDTRHTYASVLLSGGVSVAAAAEYLGHTPGELLRTYAHMLPADHDRARSVVQSAFAGISRVTDVSRAGSGEPGVASIDA